MDEISLESIRFDRSKTNRVALGGLLFHDLGRSAVRNMERVGISREVAKKISGHGRQAAVGDYGGFIERLVVRSVLHETAATLS